MEQRERNPNGTFVKGGAPPEKARRAKGIQNKITRDIREGAIAGFSRHGSNGRGEGGFAGYCFYLAKRHPKAAAKIIEKILPMTVNGSGMDGGVTVALNVQSIPSGSFLTSEAIGKLQPALLEHESLPIVETQTPEEARLLAELNNLTDEQLIWRGLRCNAKDAI